MRSEIADVVDLALAVAAAFEQSGVPYFLGGSLASIERARTRRARFLVVDALGEEPPQVGMRVSPMGLGYRGFMCVRAQSTNVVKPPGTIALAAAMCSACWGPKYVDSSKY